MYKRLPPLEISYQVPPVAPVGSPAEVVVEFEVLSPVQRADLSFHPGRGLQIDSPDTVFYYGPMEKGESRSETIRVIPEVDGTVSLHCYVAGIFGEKRMTRAMSIPVGSGPPVLAPSPGVLKTDPITGRRTVEMRAETRSE
jgi:hypothetical protein